MPTQRRVEGIGHVAGGVHVVPGVQRGVHEHTVADREVRHQRQLSVGHRAGAHHHDVGRHH